MAQPQTKFTEACPLTKQRNIGGLQGYRFFIRESEQDHLLLLFLGLRHTHTPRDRTRGSCDAALQMVQQTAQGSHVAMQAEAAWNEKLVQGPRWPIGARSNPVMLPLFRVFSEPCTSWPTSTQHTMLRFYIRCALK